jgi:signal transduction histidine kinase
MNTQNDRTQPLITARESLVEELSPGRVLIVEDEEELAELLEFNLRRQGFVTSIAYDGLSACRLIGSEEPELILLDLNLPDIDGWEICRMIRSQPAMKNAQVPIIMLTAMGTPADRVRGIELGADIYLSKPYSIKEVLLQVRQLITRRRRQQEMEDELGQLQETMEKENAWQQMLFHELRNQLLVISGYSFRLESKHQDLNLQTSQEYLKAINRSSNYLNELAEEFMIIRQLESGNGQLPMTPADPLRLLEKIVELFQPHAQNQGKSLKLHSQAASPQPLNQTAFKLILSSLLENAIKYSRTGGRIEVHLGPTATGLEIRVDDSGPGITPDDLERIFDKFYRSPTLDDKLTGTGLGLYTARTLTAAMGGSIAAQNRPEGGARFVVSLPA